MIFLINHSLLFIFRGDNNSNGGCSYGKVEIGNNCTGKTNQRASHKKSY